MKKILIVEDEPGTIELLRQMLKMQGYDTMVAKDGMSGFETAQKEHPDLILLDIMLPVLDGTETLEKLKGDPGTKDIPVLMCTVLTKIEQVEKCSRIGAEGYLLKPFDTDRVLEMIRAALDRKK